MLRIDISSRSGVGARSHNEDDLRFGHRNGQAYAVLADGAGGHRGGALASDITVRVLGMRLQSQPAFSARQLTALTVEAHAALLAEQRSKQPHEAMHATVVALWIEGALALWTHVGDSRLYLLRHGKVRCTTRDDSVVQQMVDAGYIDANEARSHPHKNQLLCAMGMEADLEPHTITNPETLRDGDVFLLCSDGWWDAVDEASMERALHHATSADEWLKRMELCIKERADARQDNYSAIAVWIGEPTLVTRAL